MTLPNAIELSANRLSRCDVNEDPDDWRHILLVTRPALRLASVGFADEIADRLREAGVLDAVARRRTGPIFDWMVGLLALQGISDAAAFSFDASNGGITSHQIRAALSRSPACSRLWAYWSFSGCGYRKEATTCANPQLLSRCPLPRHRLRKGGLNQASYSLWLFIRDVCDGDLIGWIDHRLAAADPGGETVSRGSAMREGLLDPLVNIANTGRKLWSMILAELMLVGDPYRERWVTTGAGMIAVDSLVHAFMHRTGILHRCGAEHAYGDACYRPGGCAEIIEQLAERIDAREFNPNFPATFPRFLQHALWLLCAQGGRDICNGNRIDDGESCRQLYCPVDRTCDRVPLRGTKIHD